MLVVRQCLFALSVLLWVLVIACLWGLLIAYPSWLETRDVLAAAPAIAVLNGDTYFRAEKAAALYFAGYGREIWLTDDPKSGHEVDAGTRSNRRCLEETHRVPANAIHTLPEQIQNHWLGSTFGELAVIERELARRNMDRIIIVTSRLHGRRTRATWALPVRWSRRAIIQHPERDGYVGEDKVQKEATWTALLWFFAPWTLIMNGAEAIRATTGPAAAVPPTKFRCS